jgi:hypothetical protein
MGTETIERKVWREPEHGDPVRVLHFRNHRLHRTIGPAVIRIERTQQGLRPTHLEWWSDARRNRLGGPAWIVLDPITGAPVEERWLRNEDAHRIAGPSTIRRSKDGTLIEEWNRDGKPYRPTLQERARWNATKARQGGPWHPDSTNPVWAKGIDGIAAPATQPPTKAQGRKADPERGLER